MAIIQTLKLHNTSCEGMSYPNLFTECKVPDLKRKYEAYKGGGMDTPVFIDSGGEAIEMELTYGGRIPASIRTKFGSPKHTGQLWRWAGWYTDQDTDDKFGVEIVVRGRFNIDEPNAKGGELGSGKVKVFPSYYKYTENGKVLVEIDSAKGVYKIDGEDILEEARNFLGL